MAFEMLTPENESLSEVIWDKATGITKGAAIRAADKLLESFVIIPRSDMDSPEIIDDEGVVRTGSGPECATADIHENPNWIRNRAQSLLRLADYVEDRDQIIATKKAMEEARVSRRREELAQELSPLLNVTFSELSPAAKNAIDRIIELERKAS